jgi:hypothetical protein
VYRILKRYQCLEIQCTSDRRLWVKRGRQTSWPQLLLPSPGKANRNVFTLEAKIWKNSNAEGSYQTLTIEHISLKKWKAWRPNAKPLRVLSYVLQLKVKSWEMSAGRTVSELDLLLTLYIKIVNTLQKNTEYFQHMLLLCILATVLQSFLYSSFRALSIINSQHSDQWNAQYCSTHTSIITSHCTFIHISIPKGSSSGNQTKVILHQTKL